MRFILLVFFTLFLHSSLSATIMNTKHNLSTSNISGTIKAQSEKEVCVFCHIPHQSRPVGKPLWNRSMPASAYTMYNSDYLKRLSYPGVATDLGSANDTPGALSRQCLSCHDGTVAVGAVYKLRRDFMGTNLVAMDGVDGSGMIPTTEAGFIGQDLTIHHPIGIEYDSTPTIAFDTGTRTMELRTATDVETNTQVKLYDYAGKKYVECSSCHDPHKENDKFLHVDTGANHGQNIFNTCTSCHTKTDWIGSIHQNPPATALYTDPALIAKYGTDKVSDLGCANCHTPHNAEGIPYLNRKIMGQTCFQGASSDVPGAACHGVGGAKDIESILSRTYAHPVLAATNSNGVDPAHTNLDALYGNGKVDPLGIKGMSWTDNKHAVCMDCHNPHRAQAGTHVPDGQWYADAGTSTNAVSNVLKGVPGIEPSWPTAWTQPMTFTTLESAEKEYQICFKCHSYWGIGSATNGINDLGETSDSDGTTPLTDVAWEMNINNKSGHPVVINQLGRTGSYAPKELLDVQLLEPWKSNPGLNTMYCSDCHGSDNELGGDPRGPHGSNLKFILKGANQYWPYNANGNLYNMDDIGTAGIDPGDDGIFCKNCHDIAYPHSIWLQKMAGKKFTCITCHVAVPHGSPVSRLLGYHTFPAPYNYGGNSLALYGYRKIDVDNPSSKDAHSLFDNGTFKCSGGTCHTTDDSANGAYDANLMP